MEIFKWIKVGFLVYIGARIAEKLENKYANKIISLYKNLSE